MVECFLSPQKAGTSEPQQGYWTPCEKRLFHVPGFAGVGESSSLGCDLLRGRTESGEKH